MVVQQALKYGPDAAAGAVVVATLMKWLPPIAAVFSIAWLGLQMYAFIKDRWFTRKD